MPALDRSAQFLPFAALTDHDAAVRETARLSDNRAELDEIRKKELDLHLQILREQLAQKPQVSIGVIFPFVSVHEIICTGVSIHRIVSITAPPHTKDQMI